MDGWVGKVGWVRWVEEEVLTTGNGVESEVFPRGHEAVKLGGLVQKGRGGEEVAVGRLWDMDRERGWVGGWVGEWMDK